ncbi:hypothetical protein D3C72_2006700 [compost metagenome]
MGESPQAGFNGFHFAVHVRQAFIRFTGVNICLHPFHGRRDAILIQLAIGTNDIALLFFDRRQYLFHRVLRLPLPVKAGNAAREQLPGLFHLGFLRIHFANASLNPIAIFPPQVQIPSGG